MAQLKSGSTVGGIEIAKKDCSNFPTNLPTALINQLKGTNGTNGVSGSISLVGSVLTIVSP